MKLLFQKDMLASALVLWFLLIVSLREGVVSSNTAAAFAPNHQEYDRIAQSEQAQIGIFSKQQRREKYSLASTAPPFADSPRSSEFSSVNLFSLPFTARTKKNPWKQLVPPPSLPLLHDDSSFNNGVDVTIAWHPKENLASVARSMVSNITKGSAAFHDVDDEMIEYLMQCMEKFQSFCHEHLQVSTSSVVQGFRARIVATRGRRGTKCSKFHVDHVPVRWIQSLVGPGCDYIEEDQTDESDEASSKHDFMPGQNHLKACRAREQEVALLVGNRWNEFCRQDSPLLPPVLHKSPDIPFWQGRVLLTIDVIVPHPDDEEEEDDD